MAELRNWTHTSITSGYGLFLHSGCLHVEVHRSQYSESEETGEALKKWKPHNPGMQSSMCFTSAMLLVWLRQFSHEVEGLNYNRKILGLAESTLVPIFPSGGRGWEANGKIVLQLGFISILVYFCQIVHKPSCLNFLCMPISVVNPEYLCFKKERKKESRAFCVWKVCL